MVCWFFFFTFVQSQASCFLLFSVFKLRCFKAAALSVIISAHERGFFSSKKKKSRFPKMSNNSLKRDFVTSTDLDCIHWKLPLFVWRYVRLTSSLQETVASPWAFLALQVYTPPSKLQGLRISREQMPWLEIWRNLGSSPMIIWFFNHSILGWEKERRHL